jgi:hypothetical protein
MHRDKTPGCSDKSTHKENSMNDSSAVRPLQCFQEKSPFSQSIRSGNQPANPYSSGPPIMSLSVHKPIPNNYPIPPKNQNQCWFIEGPHCLEKIAGRMLVKRRRFLQIATGQWTSSEYATKFSMRRTASAYAREYGLLQGGLAKIVSIDPCSS